MIKSLLAIPFAKIVVKKVKKWSKNPYKAQKKTMLALLSEAKSTTFGKDHNFSNIRNYEDFKKHIPVRDYEGLRSYIDKVVAGEPDILWKGKPLYFGKTSGTTSGAKYIPLTKESMPKHIEAARNSLMLYIDRKKNADFVDGKMIFLQGSPEMTELNGVKVGRLSGISAHYVPNYLQANRLPSYETNCIEDWETKIEKIIDETVNQDLRLISGIPSWVQMYFEKLVERTGKKVGEVFPNFQLFVYGGVNYEPYRKKFEALIGREVDTVELYPASEGFIAYQDTDSKDMLLNLDAGIFYEFIPAAAFFDENPPRISIEDVEVGVNYVLILNTNAGLWGYNIGDTVQFTSIKPYRLIVTGRIKHFISAFGEHVIGKEVETAMQKAITQTNASVSEFTVAPMIDVSSGLPYHEWFVEFEKEPEDISHFIAIIDKDLQNQNTYYFDLIAGKILQTLVITKVKRGAFLEYMKSIGKLGGQNKIPRLANDRKIADFLSAYKH